jgi:hypothetical protein
MTCRTRLFVASGCERATACGRPGRLLRSGDEPPLLLSESGQPAPPSTETSHKAAWRAFTPSPAIVRAGVAMSARSIGASRAKMVSTCLVRTSSLYSGRNSSFLDSDERETEQATNSSLTRWTAKRPAATSLNCRSRVRRAESSFAGSRIIGFAAIYVITYGEWPILMAFLPHGSAGHLCGAAYLGAQSAAPSSCAENDSGTTCQRRGATPSANQ